MLFDKSNDNGQSEVIGQILMVALVVVGATAIGTFYLSNIGSEPSAPQASVGYTMETEVVNTASGPESRFVLTVEGRSMPRADRIMVYYEPDGSEVGTITSVGQTVQVGDGTIKIKDEDSFTVIANYEGTRRIISRYTFDQSDWESSQ